jgi:diguanylate cyclase (GGDEF)-like protein
VVNKISLVKIVDLLFFIIFLFFISFVILDLKNISNTLHEKVKEKIETTFKSKIPIIAPLLKYGFYDDLKDMLKKEVDKNNELYKVEIISKNFKFSHPQKNVLSSEIIIPIIYKNNLLGSIKAYYSDNKIIESFFKVYFKKFSIYFFIFILFMSIGFYYIVKKLKQLNNFAREIKKINFKKTNHISCIDSYYEIVNITNAINVLLKQVYNYYKKEKELLKKLIRYKNHLKNAQKIANMFSWEYNCKKKEIVSENEIEKFINIPGIKNINDFLDNMDEEDKKILFNSLDCKKNEKFEFIIKILGKDNKQYFVKIEGEYLKLQKKFLGVSINITDEVKKQEKIEFLAYHDPLTSLPNRTYLKNYLLTYSELTKRNNKKFAILYLDLDNFKMINDTLGHESGDKLLIEVSKRLKNTLRKSDIIARIGGDEFVIVLNDINSKKMVEKIAEKIKKELSKKVNIKNNSFNISFSIGGAIFPDDSDDIEILLQYADIAMYESKTSGKNRFTFINEDLKSNIKKYYNVINELEEGLKKDEFLLYFQPKIDITNKKIIGAECLIRWNHPKRGLLTPFHFISYAEKSGIIEKIDRYVMKKVFETLKRWENDEILKNLTLAINISANEFRKMDFFDNLVNMLETYKINPHKLEIEITETMSIENFIYAVSVLEKIKALGIKVALDDFGTGYSSLNYLRNLPFDVLKIDQTFVRDLLDDKDDLVITEMIIDISKILNKENVVEGVENKQILEILSELDVSIIQGFFFSKPLPEEELKKYVVNFDYNNYI